MHTGPVDDVRVHEGRVRLQTLLPADWRDATVSDHVEPHVYVQRSPDGSERSWEYLVRSLSFTWQSIVGQAALAGSVDTLTKPQLGLACAVACASSM